MYKKLLVGMFYTTCIFGMHESRYMEFNSIHADPSAPEYDSLLVKNSGKSVAFVAARGKETEIYPGEIRTFKRYKTFLISKIILKKKVITQQVVTQINSRRLNLLIEGAQDEDLKISASNFFN